jgi:hypothetical protein
MEDHHHHQHHDGEDDDDDDDEMVMDFLDSATPTEHQKLEVRQWKLKFPFSARRIWYKFYRIAAADGMESDETLEGEIPFFFWLRSQTMMMRANEKMRVVYAWHKMSISSQYHYHNYYGERQSRNIIPCIILVPTC